MRSGQKFICRNVHVFDTTLLQLYNSLTGVLTDSEHMGCLEDDAPSVDPAREMPHARQNQGKKAHCLGTK